MIQLYQNMWFIYIVRCADGTLYTGTSTNLQRRMAEHNTNERTGAKYTRNRRPVVLVYSEKTNSRSQALKREAEIKQLKRIEKLKLISVARFFVL